MEPNKIETQIKEKLDAREIQPSAQAWDRLDAMLSVAEEKKTRRPLGWLYIAAGILVFVTLGLFFFTQNSTTVKPEINVVNTDIKKDTIQNAVNAVQTSITTPQQENQVTVSESQVVNQKASITNNQSKSNNQGVAINNQKTTNNQNQINNDKTIAFQNSQNETQKELPKVVEIKEIKQPLKTQTDESLVADLDNAAKQSANTKSTIKVDAKSLLSQVDGELEQTFREKAINRISKNYQEIKVALANRNKE